MDMVCWLKQRSTRPLAHLLRLFVACVAMGLVTLEGWHAHSSRGELLQDAGVTNSNLARSLTQHVEDSFEIAEVALSAAAGALRFGALAGPDREQANQILQLQIINAPRLHGLFVFDAAGEWLASSAEAPQNANNSDRDYFRYHREHAGTGILIGHPVVSRSSGKWIITVSRRLEDAEGDFRGVIMASLDVEYFSRYFENFDVGRNGTIALLAKDGAMLSRAPFLPGVLGQSFSQAPVFSWSQHHSPMGTLRYVSPIDGTRRLTGYTTGARYPVLLLVAVSEEEVLSDWQTETMFRMVVVCILAAGLALLGMRLSGQITRLHRSAAESMTLAKTDGLTGLANRRSFDAALSEFLQQAEQDEMPVSLLLLDVDHFKLFNDSYGHLAGDACLRAVALEIGKAGRRGQDLAARYGGEELALILPNTGLAQAALVADRLRARIQELRIPHESSLPYKVITVSIGCASFEAAATKVKMNASILIHEADLALYRAKSLGRNRVGTSDDDMPGASCSLPRTPLSLTGSMATPAAQPGKAPRG